MIALWETRLNDGVPTFYVGGEIIFLVLEGVILLINKKHAFFFSLQSPIPLGTLKHDLSCQQINSNFHQ